METPLSAMAAAPISHSVLVVEVARTGYAGMSMDLVWMAASVPVPSSPWPPHTPMPLPVLRRRVGRDQVSSR